jgi:hypothetical protein
VKYVIATMGLESGNVNRQTLDEVFRGDVVLFRGGIHALGKSRDLMDQLFKLTGAEWWVDRGQVFISRKFQPLPGAGAVISRDTGLRTQPAEVQGDLVEVITFPRPDLQVGRAAQLIHESFGGIYRIESVEHSGTNRIGDFFTKTRLGMTSQLDIAI